MRSSSNSKSSSSSNYSLSSRLRWKLKDNSFLVSERVSFGLREGHFGPLWGPGKGIAVIIWPPRGRTRSGEVKGPPKVVIIAESSSPTRGPLCQCCRSYSPIPPRHLRWLTHQLQLDRAFGSSFTNLGNQRSRFFFMSHKI